jgi:hypothetical protein
VVVRKWKDKPQTWKTNIKKSCIWDIKKNLFQYNNKYETQKMVKICKHTSQKKDEWIHEKTSALLAFREIKIKTTMRYHYMPTTN